MCAAAGVAGAEVAGECVVVDVSAAAVRVE